MKKPENFTEYLSQHPPKVQKLLKQMRSTIKKAAPGSEEVISYSMPAFKLNGMLVWYAAFKDHLSFFPKTSAIEIFKKDLADYKTSKGTLQFPFDKPLPLALITKLVKFRVKENQEKLLKKK